jgi:hypothetical protein
MIPRESHRTVEEHNYRHRVIVLAETEAFPQKDEPEPDEGGTVH